MNQSKDYWDTPIRDPQYSVKNKEEKITKFIENPTRETLFAAASTWWSTVARRSTEYYVDDVVLRKGHTPSEIAEMLIEVKEGTRSITDAEIPGMGVATITELLAVLEPDRFVTLNQRSKQGMQALGYDIQDSHSEDEDYWKFVDVVREAFEEYDLRQQVLRSDIIDELPDEVTDLEVAELAFQMHAEDEIDFDLEEVREQERLKREVDITLPRALFDEVGRTIEDNPLYADERDFIISAVRDAIRKE